MAQHPPRTEQRGDPPGPSGGSDQLCRVIRLPDPTLDEGMARLIVDPVAARTLKGYLRLLTWLGERGASSVALALRRGVLLYGSPGTGKTTVATGLPNRWAREEGEEAFLVVANTHALRSEKYGETEKRVRALFSRVAEIASTGRPTFVVVDEVESIASDRASISAETNPLDAVYSVNAVLESLDEVVRQHSNVVFLFTTNIPRLVDRAVSERVDFAVEIGLPDSGRRDLILRDALAEVDRIRGVGPAEPWHLSAEWVDFLAATDGLSPRELRHLCVLAMTLAESPETLTSRDLLAAASWHTGQAERHLETGGVYTHAYQRPDTRQRPHVAPTNAESAPMLATSGNAGDGSDPPHPMVRTGDDGRDEPIAAPETPSVPPCPTPPAERMRATRQVAVLPRRSAPAAWRLASGLIANTLRARGGCDNDRIVAALQDLAPLGHALLISHALDGGHIELTCPDLSLAVGFVFGLAGASDDLAPLAVEALSACTGAAEPALAFAVTRPVNDPYLAELISRANEVGPFAVEIRWPAERAA